jgi:hypothetical protein
MSINISDHYPFYSLDLSHLLQALSSIQKNGFVEYKARYFKKKDNQIGYGSFHIAFKPSSQ